MGIAATSSKRVRTPRSVMRGVHASVAPGCAASLSPTRRLSGGFIASGGGHGHSGALQEAPSTAPFGDGESWALSMVAPRGWVNGAVATVRREYPAAAVEFDAWFPDDESCVVSSAWLRRGYGEFRCQLFGASHARAC